MVVINDSYESLIERSKELSLFPKERAFGYLIERDKNGNEHETDNIIFYAKNKKGGSGNENLIVLGSPGTGKSYAFVRTEIMQAIRRGESVIVVDPSGELYKTMAKMIMEYNSEIKLKVLNFVDRSHSDTWNCLEETINLETKRLDSQKMTSFSSVFVNNTSTGNEDGFWVTGATNFFNAVISYVSWKRETFIMEQLKNLYECVCLDHEKYFIKRFAGYTSFAKLEKYIIKTAEVTGFNLQTIQKMIEEIYDKAPEFNITKVYNTMVYDFAKVVEAYSDDFNGKFKMPKDHPGSYAFRTYMLNEKVSGAIAQSMTTKLSLLQDEATSAMLSFDGVHAYDANEDQSVYFIITSDSTPESKPFVSLFFSMFLSDVQREYDKAEMLSVDGKINNKRAVTILLDEFFSVGRIGSDPEFFPVVMATSRKRKLHFAIILQSLPMLDQIYGVNNRNNILACCDYILYLGSNDPQTTEFVSDYCCGETTILTESHRYDEKKGAEKSYSVSNAKRRLVTPTELRQWKPGTAMLFRRGEQPVKLRTFPYTDHPLYKLMTDENGNPKTLSLYQSIKDTRYLMNEYKIKTAAESGMYEIMLNTIKNITPYTTPEEVMFEGYEIMDVEDEDAMFFDSLKESNYVLSHTNNEPVVNDVNTKKDVFANDFAVEKNVNNRTHEAEQQSLDLGKVDNNKPKKKAPKTKF